MPTLDSDHNLYTGGRHRPSSPSAGYGDSLHPTIDHPHPPPAPNAKHPVPHPIAYPLHQPLRHPPPRSPSFDERTGRAHVDQLAAGPFPEDDLVDPHDFYRQYYPDGRSPMEGLGQSDLIIVTGADSMTAPRQHVRPNTGSVRTKGSKLGPISSRVHGAYGSRNQSSSSTETSPVTTTKANAAMPSTLRTRQTSLKDLVDRFNQTPDEVPPLPRKSASRSTSTNSNSNHPTHPHHSRARTASKPKSPGVGTAAKGDGPDPGHADKAARLHHRRGRRSEDKDISPASVQSPVSPRRLRPDPNPYASQSMIDLHPPDPPAMRKPLFGEIFHVDLHHADAGYGIPGPRRRRGSEGSMHSPNPMFPDEAPPRRVSPSSPSAWYRGVTPTLEEIKTEKVIPSLPPQMHRRTQSDFAGVRPRPPSPSIRNPAADPSSPPAGSAPPEPHGPVAPLSPTTVHSYRREAQSRIPIVARRLSVNSDSGNSTPSTRTNSALERHGAPLASAKSVSAIPKPATKARSPVRPSRPASSRHSPRRGDYSPRQRPSTSPRLAAYISAPLPKKSPPLRSSRPRLPVSSASTSASRARAVDRLADRDGGDPKNAREWRAKRPPELGAVDFAARRQKIQQAFTKTVKENERQEIEAEKKRMSMAQKSRSTMADDVDDPTQTSFPIHPPDDPRRDHADGAASPRERPPEERLETTAEHHAMSEPDLVVDTEDMPSRPIVDLNQEDSPTLGGFHRYTESNQADADAEPCSALTVSTSNSVETFFDHDAPEDSPDSYHEHRTLMNHVMSMRDGGDEYAEPALATEECVSEQDDQESIQIMLGNTPVLDRAAYPGPVPDEAKEPGFGAAPGDRWSVSSWASSTRSDDPRPSDPERHAPMERIDEHSPMKPTEAAHLSISTASPAQTPQPWSPATFASPLTNRTTMDSDTYSTINRVLDHYHDQSLLSPDLMSNLQQHLITQSPDLARQGGWDPKRVTQLYLQELARARNAQSAGVTNSVNLQSRKLVESDSMIYEEPAAILEEKQVVDERLARETASPSGNLDVEQSLYNPIRASLTAPADWDMSPSISDWIHLQAESPSDEKPARAPKDWSAADRPEPPDGDRDPQASRSSTDFRPELPEIRSAGEGLGIGGLAINVTEPEDDEPPPPLPDHRPPPPPVEPSPEDISPSVHVRSPPSPSVYSRNVSGIFPAGFSSGQIVSEEAHRPAVPVTSALPSVRSSMSKEVPSVAASSEAAGKGPSPTPDQKRLIRRRHIIKELVDTEHSFGQDMKVVDDIYKGTSNVIIISAEDVKTLFSNSDQIVAFSTNFLDALKQAAKGVYVLPKSKRWRSNRTSNATSYSGNTDDQSSLSGNDLTDEERDRKTFVGEAFGHHMASMEKIYGDYLKNHDAANHKLQALQKNPKVQIWLKECRAYAHDLTSAWDLDSLLVKPVQRILKYPLLLDQLLEVTPENHPDYVKLDVAAREMKGISMRINEMKKRADLMEQVANHRKRKESDVRLGLSKAFGRRTEKLRQQVGLSDLVEDKAYAAVSEKFGSHFFQLQVVMRDVEMYTTDVQHFMTRFTDFILAIEAHIDVGQTSYPEVESKWRKFRMSTREMSMTALTDHVSRDPARFGLGNELTIVDHRGAQERDRTDDDLVEAARRTSKVHAEAKQTALGLRSLQIRQGPWGKAGQETGRAG